MYLQATYRKRLPKSWIAPVMSTLEDKVQKLSYTGAWRGGMIHSVGGSDTIIGDCRMLVTGAGAFTIVDPDGEIESDSESERARERK